LDCGSCWAFAGVSTIESAYAIKTGELNYLSVQSAIDCEPLSKGCLGGLLDNALWFAYRNNGIALENDYPYLGYMKSSPVCTDFKNAGPTTVTDI